MINTAELGLIVADMLDKDRDTDALVESVSQRLQEIVVGAREGAEVVLGVCKVTAMLIEHKLARVGVVRDRGSDRLFAALVPTPGDVPLAGRTAAQTTVALLNEDNATAAALVIAAVEGGYDSTWDLIFASLALLRQQAQ